MPGGSPRLLTTRLNWKAPAEPPQSLAEHIQQAVGRVPGLSPRERRAVCTVMLEKCRDIHFLKLLTHLHAGGPQDHSEGTLPPA
jgi:hypothetical protein